MEIDIGNGTPAQGILTLADEFSTGIAYFERGAMAYFADHYENPPMTVGQPLNPRLGWVPTFFFTINDHVTVACEVSETPYPIILGMRRKDIEDMCLILLPC